RRRFAALVEGGVDTAELYMVSDRGRPTRATARRRRGQGWPAWEAAGAIRARGPPETGQDGDPDRRNSGKTRGNVPFRGGMWKRCCNPSRFWILIHGQHKLP